MQSSSEIPKCNFIDCSESSQHSHGTHYYDYCEYHRNGGIFGSGESYEQYQIIEQDFIDFIKVVPLEHNHFGVYSPVLRDIIIRTCVQIEIFFKEWGKQECSMKTDFPLLTKYNEIGKNGFRKKERNWTIKDYVVFENEFNNRWSAIHVMPLNEDIFPFEKWTKEKDSLWWWAIYNEIKHGGHKGKKNGTVHAALYTLAALFLMHCKNHNSLSYLKKFNLNNIIREGIDTVSVDSGDITTPLDSKKYLFKANHTSLSKIELVTQKQLKDHGKQRI